QPQPNPSDPSKSPSATLIIYNAVSTTNPENYFKVENADEDRPISLLIFDEIGLKVYENNHYQQNGDYFRGYPNVKGVVGSKRLAGTYFYVVTYYFKGQQQTKKGILYVK
ncbi:MAG: gliding motility-associated C-terminal domain-containing protein, partial [Capnocytophaga ochracea]